MPSRAGEPLLDPSIYVVKDVGGASYDGLVDLFELQLEQSNEAIQKVFDRTHNVTVTLIIASAHCLYRYCYQP
jgi:hypothetical protein